ncbi:hypothetical protein Asi03nite_15200 [Actinoplanes siamensis]|uniref:Uncharacterized protein n=1 Tax=Actinoplanes siamensis TaxID=1223317 RepID=A0A919TIA9_9ACTN|nr:hypothetical protein Asi03nite_15200 [Actinoplanes siamensis]
MLVGILVLALHVGLGLFSANWLWSDTDDPHQWMYFYGTGGCCIAPVTGALGAFLVNTPRFKAIGVGALLGLGLALIGAAVAWGIDFTPSWVTSG